ncbi:hypothetical protein [Convivina praedatoris]|uniref:Uncharacterized protein n=1 Tax=Convivina praedatoris TaxID=2880963 RepID=A0ABM9D1N6_9LACO|nr:hypothetical protein [Convivina sp. LMG 32447]CAH1849910.1 hypothetical protein R077815_00012 [Convivina sp. LMG 32447]CAH1849914.1 hypothetical protein LMG032447_00014 [Convivina sp. LMG 32447]CAH1851335.1 hypothetical protein R078138_00318 [Convivina sp. LMG 32447]
MPQYNFILASARVETDVKLPQVPQIGDVISMNSDVDSPHYLVCRIELFANSDIVNVHVQRFANQLSAKLAIDGFRNNRNFIQ